MATPSSVLAWRIPGTGEPGGLPSVGSHRVGHDWSDLAAAGKIIHLFIPLFIDWARSSLLCMGFSLVSRSGGSSPLAVRGFLIAVTSLTAEHGLQVCGFQQLWHIGSVVVAHGLVAPRHVGSSQTRDRTGVPCIARQIPNHWTTREAPRPCFSLPSFMDKVSFGAHDTKVTPRALSFSLKWLTSINYSVDNSSTMTQSSELWGCDTTTIETQHQNPSKTATHRIVIQFSSVAQSCPTLCDPMNHSTPGLPVHHQLPEFTQTHVHWVSDAIQPSHPLSPPSPPAPNPSQHQSLFQWVNSSHEVARVLEFQL